MRARGLKGFAGTLAVGAAALGLGAGVASAEPLRITLPGHFSQQPTIAQCEAEFDAPCYTAGEMRHAYGVDQLNARGLTGRGETIVIIDSYGSPSIQGDLQAFDRANGLPSPPSLEVITPAGTPPAWNPNAYPDQPGWAGETTLDVEASHAMAPGANILLVETPVDETEGVQGSPQMMDAEQYVVDHHLGDVISQSFGSTELNFQNANGHFDPQLIYGLRYAFQDAAAHGVTVLAAAGDAGAASEELDETDYYPFRANSWPSSDPLVTSVGGTELQLDRSGNRTAPDSVWNDPPSACESPCAGGGGVSAAFARPSYQDGVRYVVGDARGTPDVSMAGACEGALNTYESFPAAPGFPAEAGSWSPACGTSEATPLFAGEVALADQIAGHPLGLLNPALYAIGDGSGSGLTDITNGNNTVTFTNSNGVTYTVTGYNATRGYDLASGLGTANPLLPFQLAAFASNHAS